MAYPERTAIGAVLHKDYLTLKNKKLTCSYYKRRWQQVEAVWNKAMAFREQVL